MLSTNLLSVLFLTLGLLLPGLGSFPKKTGPQDCCAKNLACCGKDHDGACCATAAKLGCCTKAMGCCAKEKSCCAAVQPCCTEGAKCCEEAKTCCGISAKAAAKECCGYGGCRKLE